MIGAFLFFGVWCGGLRHLYDKSKFTPELVSGRDMSSHSWGKPQNMEIPEVFKYSIVVGAGLESGLFVCLGRGRGRFL